ncbi:MAG: hypothetical protein ACRDPY_41410 [Streptosporangiaceae bacterium]
MPVSHRHWGLVREQVHGLGPGRAHAGKSTIYRHWRDKVDLIADA